MTGAARALPRVVAPAPWWQRRGLRRATTFYALVSPWFIGFVALTLVPLALAFVISFTNYDGLNLAYLRFVGLENYARALDDPDALYSMQRTLLFMAVVVPVGVVVQLGLAFLVDRPFRLTGFFRTLFYLPHVIPIVAGAWVWKIFTDPTGGLLNALIGVAVPGTNVAWIVEYPTVVLALFTIWAAAGGGMLIFLAGLQGIPHEYREAAMLDGASGWQVARWITLPLLTPVIFFQLVVGIIVTLQILVQPLLLAPGALLSPGMVPPRDNYLYVVHAYNRIFANQLFGYGSALLWILFLVVLVLTVLLFRTSRRWVHYGTEL